MSKSKKYGVGENLEEDTYQNYLDKMHENRPKTLLSEDYKVSKGIPPYITTIAEWEVYRTSQGQSSLFAGEYNSGWLN